MMYLQFNVSHDDQAKIQKWLKEEVYPEIITKQKEAFKHEKKSIPFSFLNSWELGFPYEGAIGGGLTYEFTPNSIGMTTKVRYGEYTLDLTRYEEW